MYEYTECMCCAKIGRAQKSYLTKHATIAKFFEHIKSDERHWKTTSVKAQDRKISSCIFQNNLFKVRPS